MKICFEKTEINAALECTKAQTRNTAVYLVDQDSINYLQEPKFWKISLLKIQFSTKFSGQTWCCSNCGDTSVFA